MVTGFHFSGEQGSASGRHGTLSPSPALQRPPRPLQAGPATAYFSELPPGQATGKSPATSMFISFLEKKEKKLGPWWPQFPLLGSQVHWALLLQGSAVRLRQRPRRL